MSIQRKSINIPSTMRNLISFLSIFLTPTETLCLVKLVFHNVGLIQECLHLAGKGFYVMWWAHLRRLALENGCLLSCWALWSVEQSDDAGSKDL